MTQRAMMSQVKFKVRYNALLLGEFKVADMVQATGLKPESVRTELQRMKQEGLLTVGLNGEHTGRGAPPALYQLANDPERRLALSESVSAMYPTPPSAQPSSQRFRAAQRALDEAMNAKGAHRRQLLASAADDLALAVQAEGGEWASEQVQAYMRYEQARLAYLHAEYDTAKREFALLGPLLATFGDDTMAQRASEFEVCAELGARFGTSVPRNPAVWARYLAHVTSARNIQPESPLAALLLQVIGRLA